MARPIVVEYQGVHASFDHVKLDRTMLYGKRARLALGPDGNPCQQAELSDDGAVLIRPGMTAQATFDDTGVWTPNAKLVGLDEEGRVLQKVESTLGRPQAAKEARPEDLLDLHLSAVYLLEPVDLPKAVADALLSGKVLRFALSDRDGYRTETAFLVSPGDRYFALIGEPVAPGWSELSQIVPEGPLAEGEAGELDFEVV